MSVRQKALGEYLRARRGLLSPSEFGIAVEPGRRVHGLRRDEVATRAGISTEYYLRLEQGTGQQASDQVLFALSRALMLNTAELDYMFRLAFPALDNAFADAATHWAETRLDPGVSELLSQWPTTPAIVLDRNQDIVESNPIARLFGAGQLEPGRNVVANVFGPAMRADSSNWEEVAAEATATLRFHSDPEDPRLQELVAELSEDADFRRLWARHDVKPLQHGEIRSQHMGADGVNFHFQNLTIPGGGGFVMTLMFGEPGTPAGEIMATLAQAVQR